MSEMRTGGRVDQDVVVLLLEDDDADAYLTKRALSAVRRVAKVVRTKNGEEAVALLTSEQLTPDIAFVDLQMPKMNGLEFLDHCMDQRLANIPMVVLTSSSARSDLVRSRVRGALWVITKPENPDELSQVLAAAIEAFLPRPDAPASNPWGSAEVAPAIVSPRPVEKATAPAFGRRIAR